MLLFLIYLVIIGGKHGYVTPAASPCNTRTANKNQKLFFAATGISKVRMAQNIFDPPSTILVPYFSAKDPPTTCSTIYP